jgi:hypothetical protein
MATDAAQNYKASAGCLLGTRFRQDGSPGGAAGTGSSVRSFAWSAAPPMVSRRTTGFKANVGTEGVSPGQIPAIPSKERPLLKDAFEATTSSLLALPRPAQQRVGDGRNGPEGHAGAHRGRKLKAKARWHWRACHRMK